MTLRLDLLGERYGSQCHPRLPFRQLSDAQSRHTLATAAIYEYVRHPQYVGFIVIMLGFLLQWPTLLTLVMFPVLVVMYARLARMEEHEALREFEDQYRGYMFIALLPPQWGIAAWNRSGRHQGLSAVRLVASRFRRGRSPRYACDPLTDRPMKFHSQRSHQRPGKRYL